MTNVIAFNRESTDNAVIQSVEKSKVFTDYRGKEQQLFDVDSLPISSERGIIQGKKGLFVGDNCINIVSDRYEIHQPSEFYQMFFDITETHGLEINRVVANPHNGGLLLSAKYADCKILGEEHDVNLTFYTSHCGKYRTILTLDLLRIACMNQVPTLYKNNQRHIVSEKHYKNALDIDWIGKHIENLPTAIEAYAERAQALSDKALSFNSFMDLFVEHYKLDENAKQFNSKVEKMRQTYYNAQGQKGLVDNGYKAFCAITFANTHYQRNTVMKEENRLFKGGQDSLDFADRILAA